VMEVMNKTVAALLILRVLMDSALVRHASVMGDETVHWVKMRLVVPSVVVIS